MYQSKVFHSKNEIPGLPLLGEADEAGPLSGGLWSAGNRADCDREALQRHVQVRTSEIVCAAKSWNERETAASGAVCSGGADKTSAERSG